MCSKLEVWKQSQIHEITIEWQRLGDDDHHQMARLFVNLKVIIKTKDMSRVEERDVINLCKYSVIRVVTKSEGLVIWVLLVIFRYHNYRLF